MWPQRPGSVGCCHPGYHAVNVHAQSSDPGRANRSAEIRSHCSNYVPSSVMNESVKVGQGQSTTTACLLLWQTLAQFRLSGERRHHQAAKSGRPNARNGGAVRGCVPLAKASQTTCRPMECLCHSSVTRLFPRLLRRHRPESVRGLPFAHDQSRSNCDRDFTPRSLLLLLASPLLYPSAAPVHFIITLRTWSLTSILLCRMLQPILAPP